MYRPAFAARTFLTLLAAALPILDPAARARMAAPRPTPPQAPHRGAQAHAQAQPPPQPQTHNPAGTNGGAATAGAGDLDTFMEQVLARREVNRAALEQYVLDEAETFEVLGPGRVPLRRMRREFNWYVRDGMHVRSPVRFDGVAIPDAARREYEDTWIKRERTRQERRAPSAPDAKSTPDATLNPDARSNPDAQSRPAAQSTPDAPGADGLAVGAGGATEPRFVSEAYFMDFKFEPGNYYLAGREQLEGHDVLRIEYYPTHLFDESDDEKRPREMKRRKDERQEQDIERKMNKTALVTLWVDPREHQIVKYTFDNVWLDFLPGAWLVRLDRIRASMTMGQPFPGVWLPRAMDVRAGVTLATGSFEASYARAFSNYRKAEVKTIISVPKGASAEAPERPAREAARGAGRLRGLRPEPQPVSEARLRPVAWTVSSTSPRSRTTVHTTNAPTQIPETVREIRVHGNAALTDDEVLALAGIAVGDAVTPDLEEAVVRRLRASRRFDTVEVRKRFRSIDDPSDVAMILLVHERPGVRSTTAGGTGEPASPWHQLKSRVLFFPILNYTDGYGLTYGGRLTVVDLLGAKERISVPLTLGATKRAAVEAERTFGSGPLTRLSSSAGVWSRENPRYGIDERRREVTLRAERQFAHIARAGAGLARSGVRFGPLDDTLWTVGADAALDTRGDPAFPANAFLLGGGWSQLHVRARDTITRYTADARGYWRVFRQQVLAARLQYSTADAPLPLYERALLGGASSLRGFRAGAFDGDRMTVASAEWRAPLTSVLRRARLGLTVFADGGKAVDYGARLGDAPWRRGAGAGLFLVVPFVQLNVDIAHGAGAGTRLHVGTGFSF